MKNLLSLIQKALIAACLCFLLISCGKVSQENFDKIKPGMTMKEVIGILGEPTTSESINIAGISGTSSVWKDNQAEIDIQFLNDQVTVKAFSKLNASAENATPEKKK